MAHAPSLTRQMHVFARNEHAHLLAMSNQKHVHLLATSNQKHMHLLATGNQMHACLFAICNPEPQEVCCHCGHLHALLSNLCMSAPDMAGCGCACSGRWPCPTLPYPPPAPLPLLTYSALHAVWACVFMCVQMADKVGLAAVRFMRTCFDIATGYGPNMTEAKWLQVCVCV